MVVGVFSLSAFRLLPALRTLLSGWTRIQNAAYSLDTLEEGLKDSVDKTCGECKEITFDNEIAVNRLSYAYPDGGTVLKEFNCAIRKGEHVGFRGPSGVGKSTLFNLLAGLIVPDAGEIRIDGVLLDSSTHVSWMKRVGYVPQEVFIFNGTLAENIAIGCEQIDYGRVEEILELVGLGRWAKELPCGMDTCLNEAGSRVSGGQKQRIGIARALYKEAEVLLLDEATSALDYMSEREINETLARLKEQHNGLTVLSIAHRESSLAYCERIIIIDGES